MSFTCTHFQHIIQKLIFDDGDEGDKYDNRIFILYSNVIGPTTQLGVVKSTMTFNIKTNNHLAKLMDLIL